METVDRGLVEILLRVDPAIDQLKGVERLETVVGPAEPDVKINDRLAVLQANPVDLMFQVNADVDLLRAGSRLLSRAAISSFIPSARANTARGTPMQRGRRSAPARDRPVVNALWSFHCSDPPFRPPLEETSEDIRDDSRSLTGKRRAAKRPPLKYCMASRRPYYPSPRWVPADARPGLPPSGRKNV